MEYIIQLYSSTAPRLIRATTCAADNTRRTRARARQPLYFLHSLLLAVNYDEQGSVPRRLPAETRARNKEFLIITNHRTREREKKTKQI